MNQTNNAAGNLLEDFNILKNKDPKSLKRKDLLKACMTIPFIIPYIRITNRPLINISTIQKYNRTELFNHYVKYENIFTIVDKLKRASKRRSKKLDILSESIPLANGLKISNTIKQIEGINLILNICLMDATKRIYTLLGK
jgi:hypothetical protein